jgi:uncharacterized membrane protein YkvA (DUF1232 family)
MKIRRLFRRLKTHVRIYWLIFRDKRTPKISKILVLLAIAYLLLPFDIIPDYIPFAGLLDELIILPIILYVATIFVSKEVVEESKRKVNGHKTSDGEILEGEVIN